MRIFKEADFTWVDADLMVSNARYLAFPAGTPLREFKVAGFREFTYEGIAGDTFVYRNTDGLTAQVFND